ncbi:MAG: hypothetical protein LBK00_12090 [Treponema sp.]|jgi:hypothetical protein|nr:hypothetical protein [Treponema sp.]
MNKFWSLFWKLFGVSLLVAFAIGIILGIAQHSIALVYSFGQTVMAFGLGISGAIGLCVMPIQLYFEYRASHKEVKE